ncbi:DNA-3-methyladenine glycosylase [Allorhizobium sp. BGMRC 0089]|uniref:DNA-3-methyladenine glycosylase n=1 Tax=Allorhizobium sonneratiae TaxID=2934936 RepID=UPI0020333DF4|nr:DNA-3-methyladenine glycosylase [Allorhizobium sonneratiae]MCM2293190.1 DNA-3-methyladenine glycosylase [Allorhizobium sonneratiae]
MIGFSYPALDVAPQLIGALLMFHGCGGIIVEVEAYEPDDPASHSFSGPTQRNAAMFGPPAHAYVYRSYGIHWCFNIVCRSGSAVLIRALQPTAGLDEMITRRGVNDLRLLCSGPGRLAQALAISGAQNGDRVDTQPFSLVPAAEPAAVIAGPRIGISKARDLPWRFGLKGSAYLSKAFKNPIDLSVR